jgi:hypothetical protein
MKTESLQYIHFQATQLRYIVNLRWSGGRSQRAFSVARYGSAEAALKAAIAYRDAQVAQHGAQISHVANAAKRDRYLRTTNFRSLRARAILARPGKCHFRVKFKLEDGEHAYRCFHFDRYASPRCAFNAALRFRDRIERMPLKQRKEALV